MSENSSVSNNLLKLESDSLKKTNINNCMVLRNNALPQTTPIQNNMEIIPEQNESDCKSNDKQFLKYGFTIDALELETIMGKYKERGNDCQDLKYFQKNGGIEKLITALKTNIQTGITDTIGREEIFGSNKVFVESVPHFCLFVWEALEDLMVRILIVAAIVQIVLAITMSDDGSTDWVDGVSIVLAIVVVVVVGSITNYQKEIKFHELNEIQNEGTKFQVIRNGIPEQHINDDLLVGDLINIGYGDIISADLLLVEGNGIKMDESALTGESDAMKKETYIRCLENIDKGDKAPSPLILSGTFCIEGNGKAIVLAVGDHSQKGIIKRTVDNAQEKSQTPLELKLDRIAELIGYFGLGAGVVTLVALFIRFGFSFSKEIKEYNNESTIETIMVTFMENFPYKLKNDEEIISNTNNKLTDPKDEIYNKILSIVILCVSIIVVAIPEGLPLAVTLSLAFSIKKMMDNNNLVRKMHACETMGGANYICTDKTGTLTKNEMSVFTVLTGKYEKELVQNLEVTDVGKVDIKDKNKTKKQIREDYTTIFKNENYWKILKVAIALNVDCTIKKLETPDINGDIETYDTKNKTDKAFIDFLYRFKSPISIEKQKYLSENNYKQFPFDSKRKRMTTFVANKEFPKGYRLFSKGGAENACVFCKSFLDPDTGAVKKLEDDTATRIKQSIKEFNKNKLRSLYIAYKDITKQEYDNCEKADNSGKLLDQYDLVFLCVFGIKDSLRDGVKEAVKKCKEASVNVIMVTGDNIVTATAIAKECGILGEEVDLKKLEKKDIEDNPELMNDKSQKNNYIESLLQNQPHAITGNSFYTIIGGLICQECMLDTNLCNCPKTESEAKLIAKNTGKDIKPIKKDIIKYMDKFKTITEKLKVMARSQPIHKYSLVLGLKTLGSVVAVTGDGTNDAPALSKSDVGFAMFAGTDIAKQASDIVIIDNNFSSIITAIIYGRNIYDNIRKFLQFQLTVNFCACLIVFICACIGNETPLTPIQMLWVNLIMDSLGSLALATEQPYDELLKREPTKRNESIINGRMCKHILFQSLVQIAILLILYLIAPKFIKEYDLIRLAENHLILYCYGKLPGDSSEDNIIYGTESSWYSNVKLKKDIDQEECGSFSERQTLLQAYQVYYNSNGASTHMTILFNVFVFYTLFNQINCRVIDDSFNIFVRIQKSLLFPLICILEMALQVVIIEFGNEALHVVERGLEPMHWLISIGFSLITFVVSIIVKFIPLEKSIEKLLKKKQKKKEKEKDDLEREIEKAKKEKISRNSYNEGGEVNDEDVASCSSLKGNRQVIVHKKNSGDDGLKTKEEIKLHNNKKKN